LYNKQALLNQLAELNKRNDAANATITAELKEVNNALTIVKANTNEQLCLLWQKNEWLDLQGDVYAIAKPTAKVAAPTKIIKKEVIIKKEIVENNTAKKDEPKPFIGPNQEPALPRVEIQKTESTVYYKPDSSLWMAQYSLLKRDIDNLKNEIKAYQTLLDKLMKQKAEPPVIVTKPVFGKKSKDNTDAQALEIAIAKLRKELTPTIIRDTIVIQQVVEKPVITYVDKVVEKPVIQYVEKTNTQFIDRPVEKVVEKVVEKQVTKVEQLLTLPPDVILFDVSKSYVKAQYRKRLDYYAEQLKKFPELSVMLQGFTDNTGNAAANLKLSELRANNVAAYLKSKGVSASQITTDFSGANNPVADNTNANNKSQNRRVEVSFNR
jgi:outer membrane protein OmpA-like peptidoglycan-associated protein